VGITSRQGALVRQLAGCDGGAVEVAEPVEAVVDDLPGDAADTTEQVTAPNRSPAMPISSMLAEFRAIHTAAAGSE
jgi:hypothetical protein